MRQKPYKNAEMSEWFKEHDWKSCDWGDWSGGSNPLLCAIKTHTKGALKRLPCVSFSLSFIRFKGFLYPFFFLMQCGCRFLPTRYLTQELSNHRTISNFYNLCTKSSVRARRHKKIIAPLHP